MPLLSIVVPFYNVERYFEACLDSLARQTFTDLEVVMVDDGSTDHSVEIAERFCEQDPRFRLVRQENTGLGPARNAGVVHADGDLVAFVDSDDVVERHAYRSMIDVLAETGSDFVAAKAERFSNHGVRGSVLHGLVFDETRLRTHVRHDHLLGIDRMAWNKVYWRAFYDSAGLEFPAMLLEDFPVSVTAHVQANTVDALSDVVYFWRVRDGGEPSITQRSAEIHNLSDRVESALMVLDILEGGAPDAVPLVRQHLLEVDVAAAVAALRLNPGRMPEVLALARRLNDRLGVQARSNSAAFYRVMAAMLDDGDVEGLLELDGHGRRFGKIGEVVRHGRMRRRLVEALPGLRDRRVPLDRYRTLGDRIQFSLRVEEAAWNDVGDHVRLELLLQLLARSPIIDEDSLHAWFEGPGGARHDLEVRQEPRKHPFFGENSSLFRLSVDPSEVADRGPRRRALWRLRVEVDSRIINAEPDRVATPVGRGRFLGPAVLAGGVLAQPVYSNASLALRLRSPEVVVYRCRITTPVDEIPSVLLDLLLDDAFGTSDPRLEIAGPQGVLPVVVPVEVRREADAWHGTVRLPVTDLFEPKDYVTPFIRNRNFRLRVVAGGGSAPLAVGPGFESVRVRWCERMLTIGGNLHGNVIATESINNPVIDRVEWVSDDTLRFQGSAGNADSLPEEMIAEFFSEPGHGVELKAPLRAEHGQLAFDLDVAQLVGLGEALTDSDEGRQEWHLLIPLARRTAMQVMDRTATRDLPPTRVVRDRRVMVSVGRNDVVRLIVE